MEREKPVIQLDHLYCDLCDQEVFITQQRQERAMGNVAFKRAGTKRPRRYYCAACTDDGGGYPSAKFEQA